MKYFFVIFFYLLSSNFAQKTNVEGKIERESLKWKAYLSNNILDKSKIEEPMFNKFKFGSIEKSQVQPIPEQVVLRENKKILLDNWEKLPGPVGGSVRQFYQFFNRIYAIADNELFVLEEQSWKSLNFEQTVFNIIQCLQVFEDGSILIGDDFGFYHSHDNGISWSKINLGDWRIYPRDILVTKNNEILLATSDGIFKSTSSISNYSRFALEGKNITTLSLDINNNLWVGTPEGIYKANFTSLNWNKVNIDSGYYRKIIFDSKGVIYTYTDYQILRSKDLGNTWDKLTGAYFTDIFIDKNNELIVTSVSQIFSFMGEDLVWESPINTDFLLTTFIADNGNIFTGTLGSGVFLYDKLSSTFENFSNGMNASTIRGILYLQNGDLLVCSDANKLFLSNDDGITWQDTLDLWSRCMETSDDGSIYIAAGSGIIKSIDYAKSWIQLDINVSPYFINAMDISKDSQSICVGTSHGEVYISHDSGKNFLKIKDHDYRFVDAVEILNKNTYLIYCGPLLYTDDGGQTFVTINDSLFMGVNDIESDGYGNIYMAAFKSILKSHDGLIWDQIEFDITGARYISFDKFNQLYVTNRNGGVYSSKDRFLSWETVANVINNTHIWSFCLSPNGYLYNGSQDKGLYRKKIEIKQNVPAKSTLLQNFPNPFNNRTKIYFTLNKTSNVKLEIFDILGRRITSLLDKNLENGYHQVEWNADGFSSGIYYYRVTVGNFYETKKMILLK